MRISRRSSITVAIVACLGMLVGALALAVQVLPASTGAVVGGEDGGYNVQGLEVVALPGTGSVLASGDIVTAIAGTSLEAWPIAPGHVPAGGQPSGAPATVPASILRDGEPLELTVPLSSYPLADYLASNAGSLTFALLLFLVALFVFLKRPWDLAAAGLLIFAVGVAASTPAYLAGIDPLAFARGTASVSFVAIGLVYYLIWSGMLHFALAFPRPHPWLDRHPRGVALPYLLVYGALGISFAVAVLLDPGGLAVLGLSLGVLGNVVVISAVGATLGLMIFAWRRSAGEARRMLRGLLLTAAVATVGAAILGFLPEIVSGRPLVPWSIQAVVGLPFVVALAAAVLRHRAFDIDVVISRSLVYGGMTVVVLAIYVATVSVLGTILRESADYAVALLATALAALAALPVRDLLQRTVDRALYGDRDEPVRAMRRLGERLTWTLAPEAIPAVIVETVADSLRLPYVALETDDPDPRLVAAHGQAPSEGGELITINLVAHSLPVGRLVLGARGPREPLSAADRRLLDDLARQAGPAVDNLVLNEALRRSRERIVVAGEEERRRLRRDLHDGLGPTLASIGMRAEAAIRLIEDDPGAARTMLDEVHEGVQAAIADVRRLVDGLRPPALDELGLVGAIRQQAERLGVDAPEFVVESPAPLGELPAAVEVAAYRIAVEAMTNVVRHARAARCQIRVLTDERDVAGSLTLEVIDDGDGLRPGASAGVGLASMRERASEVGGQIRIEGDVSGGTRVQAWLPLGSA